MVTQLTPAFTTCLVSPDPDETARRDTEIVALCGRLAPWGLATAIDLRGCDPKAIRDPRYLARFVEALCDLIELKRFGPPVIVRLGADARVSGYCLAQLIETSLVSGHFAEESDAAYIDIFSRRPYPPYAAAEFCRRWFGAATASLSVVLRQA
jgi:S-adenosylmethionine decarboxylase